MMDRTATVLINIAGIPHWPISHERLQDPVILDCVCKGTLSRGRFVTWYQHLDSASTKINGVLPNCPICGSGLQSFHVTPNVPLRATGNAGSHCGEVNKSWNYRSQSSLTTTSRVRLDWSCRSIPCTLSGHVRVYDWTGIRWVQVVGP